MVYLMILRRDMKLLLTFRQKTLITGVSSGQIRMALLCKKEFLTIDQLGNYVL